MALVIARYATAASVREARRTPTPSDTPLHDVRERRVALGVIRVLAGHVNVRTTQIYVDVTGQRKAEGIAALEHIRHPLAA